MFQILHENVVLMRTFESEREQLTGGLGDIA